MKKITKMFIILVLVSFSISCATMISPKVEGEIKYVEVIEFDKVAKGDLFIEANVWMVNTFVDSKEIVEYKNKEEGVISGKYTFSYTEGMYSYTVRSTITINVKDNKLRLKAENPYYKVVSLIEEGYESNYRKLETRAGKKRCIKKWKALVSSLEQHIEKNILKDDNW